MITPIILSGGKGSRLWPLSRVQNPKQYWALLDEKTLIQKTALRFASTTHFSQPLVICNDQHRFLVAEQLREINISPAHIVLETKSLNTAAAITVSCLLQTDPEQLLLVLPADHCITNAGPLFNSIQEATSFAQQGKIVTFGIQPTRPEIGYGYIEIGSPLNANKTLFTADNFTEKPHAQRAKEFLSSKRYYWNSGMFLFSVKTMLQEMELYQPELLELCQQAVKNAKQDLDFLRLDYSLIPETLGLSIDYAVMEKTKHACVAPVDIEWSDVGSWDALWEISNKDPDGNVTIGDVVTEDVKNSYIRSEHPLVCTVGLENAIVCATKDTVLVANKSSLPKLPNLLQKLQVDKRSELSTHTRVYRPWGYYETLDAGDRFQVKRIVVKPGEKTSTQIHYHRSEHWVVVKGLAKVTRGDEVCLIHENNSIYLPMGTRHRVENPGKIPLHLIEVQSGSYLGEDDIVRIEDEYGRVNET